MIVPEERGGSPSEGKASMEDTAAYVKVGVCACCWQVVRRALQSRLAEAPVFLRKPNKLPFIVGKFLELTLRNLFSGAPFFVACRPRTHGWRRRV